MERYEPLTGYQLSGCAVRRRNIMSFWGQKWDNPDPLEVRPTRVYYFYPDKPEERRWAFREPAETRGLRGCAVTNPEERWVFVADDGQVYVAGGGVGAFEEPITSKPFSFFSNVKRVSPGRAVAVGPRRKVFVREAPDRWRQLEAGLFPQGDQTNHDSSGFSDIDGFSESDLYACGGRGDLWHFDGRLWTQVEIPTNDNLWRLCCASNGRVYVITGRREILMGRDQAWTVVSQNLTDQTLESIVVFSDKVIISTESALFEMVGDALQLASLGDMPPMRSRSFLAVGDGILVVAGSSDACSFDGTRWSVIIPSAT
jgi:hypothetical protein